MKSMIEMSKESKVLGSMAWLGLASLLPILDQIAGIVMGGSQENSLTSTPYAAFWTKAQSFVLLILILRLNKTSLAKNST